MENILNFIAKPFGVIMQLVYNTIAFQSYGLAIIFFSIFVKILLFPLNLKQQMSLIKTQELTPELKELERMYAGDKEKLQQEQFKLYQKYNINPMAGCFPLLIQLPIIMTLFEIVRKPLTFISGISASAVKDLAGFVGNALDMKTARVNEIIINNFFFTHAEKLQDVAGKLSGSDIINMKFLKIFDLGLSPSLGKIFSEPAVYLPLLLIPIISAFTTYLSQKISTPATNSNKVTTKNTEEKKVSNPLETMTKIMPLITLFFTFSVPAGVGLYWIMGNILGILQSYVTKKFVLKKKEGNE